MGTAATRATVSWSGRLTVGENTRPVPPFTKVLVANRGEIAVRIFRTLHELGIRCVAVYSAPDRDALHVAVADEAYLIGAGPPDESYLRADRIVDVALRAGAEAVHPGYGFLAENAAFARHITDAGLVWIGPPPEAIEAMGSKIAAREEMTRAGVPIIPGTTEPAVDVDHVRASAGEIGYPVAVKASAGGGGKGLKIARTPGEVERAYESARREGESYFADSTVYVERYLDDPRHVEVQVLADDHGNVVHLGERDCTIQRRHQKLVEETPSPAVDAVLRERIGRIAIEAAIAVGYRSAGTIEGLLAQDGSYYFLEMNTRVQVEHTVTEAVTGLDIVREQIRVAAGEPLSVTQADVQLRGHAIECRINAEDASRGFIPSPGRITAYREPGGIGVRVDSGVRSGDLVSDLYDPLIAKLVVHDVDREAARRRMLRALEEYVVGGPKTLIAFHRALLSSPCFVEAGTCRELLESDELAHQVEELHDTLSHTATRLAGGSDGTPAATRERVVALEVDGRRHDIRIHTTEPPWADLGRRHKERSKGLTGEAPGAIASPMQGLVLSVGVADGDHVEAGDLICVIEAMKMENEITAHRDGVVSALAVMPGQQVVYGQTICVIGGA
jgi:acetyl-CoA/propionyl-CoA carboxylase, biotin carboxylase, biotin carboxyl carrier protein